MNRPTKAVVLNGEAPPMMNFERYRAAMERVARHAYFPGKEEVVGQCLEDIDDLLIAGQITAEQRAVLHEALLGPARHAA